MSFLRPTSSGQRRTFLEIVLSVPSYYVLFLAFLWGFVLIGGSIVLNLDDVIADRPPYISSASGTVPRQVGYVYAFNWSIIYSLLLPVVLYLMVESLRAICETLDALHNKNMVRDRQMNAVRDPRLTDSWKKGNKGRSRMLWIFGVIVPSVVCIGEWFTNNFLRLMRSHLAPVASYSDYDWGLKAIMAGWTGGRSLVNAGFDLLAFCSEGILLGCLLSYFLLLIDLTNILPLHPGGDTLLLVPNLKGEEEDRRRGFESFEGVLLQMLFIALAAYVMCYLVRLQGMFMIGWKARDLWGFVQSDILAGVKGAFSKDLSHGVASLFSVESGTLRGFLAWTLSFLVFVFCVVVVEKTVRRAAKCAQKTALEYYDQPGAHSLFGDPREDERRRAAAMTLWPLGYIKPNVLLLGVLAAVTTLYFYRVGLFIGGMAVGVLVLRLLSRLKKWGKD